MLAYIEVALLSIINGGASITTISNLLPENKDTIDHREKRKFSFSKKVEEKLFRLKRSCSSIDSLSEYVFKIFF